MDSDFSTIFSILIPRDQGKHEVHRAQPPCLVWLNISGRSPCIPECAVMDRLTHCHSSHRHGAPAVDLGDCFSRFTPLDPLCSAQQRHLS